MPRGIPRERHSEDFLNAEVNTADVFADEDVLDYTTPGALIHNLASIITPVSEREFTDAVEYEKFMQDHLVIVIQRTSERYEAPTVMVGDNGRQAWLPRGRKIKVPRYFVESLAHSQTRNYATEVDPDPNATYGMRVRRFGGLSYPFTVLHDPNPRGERWLRRVMREGA